MKLILQSPQMKTSSLSLITPPKEVSQQQQHKRKRYGISTVETFRRNHWETPSLLTALIQINTIYYPVHEEPKGNIERTVLLHV